MITILATRNGVYSLCDTHKDFCNIPHRYIEGLQKPHYPVPAVRIQCCIWSGFISFWNRTTGDVAHVNRHD